MRPLCVVLLYHHRCLNRLARPRRVYTVDHVLYAAVYYLRNSSGLCEMLSPIVCPSYFSHSQHAGPDSVSAYLLTQI